MLFVEMTDDGEVNPLEACDPYADEYKVDEPTIVSELIDKCELVVPIRSASVVVGPSDVFLFVVVISLGDVISIFDVVSEIKKVSNYDQYWKNITTFKNKS